MMLHRSLSFLLLFAMMSQNVVAATYWVNNSALGTVGYDCVDGDTTLNGLCTLHKALSLVNAEVGGDSVKFTKDLVIRNDNLNDVFSIAVDNVTIDAWDGGDGLGGPLNTVELDGGGDAVDAHDSSGITIGWGEGDNVLIKGLYIYGFKGAATAAIDLSTGNNATISNNVIGLDSAGVVDANTNGIKSDNALGTNNLTINDNVISGNTVNGISAHHKIGNLTINDNKIGVKEDGTTEAGNGSFGVWAADVESITIEDNTIAYNGGYNVYLGDHANGIDNATIRGNTIKDDGVTAGTYGIYVDSDINTSLTIGGDPAGVDSNECFGGAVVSITNVISGLAVGLRISGDFLNVVDPAVIRCNYFGIDAAGDSGAAETIGTSAMQLVGSGDFVLTDNVVGNVDVNGDTAIDVTGLTTLEMYGNRLGIGIDSLTPKPVSVALLIISTTLESLIFGAADMGNFVAATGGEGVRIEEMIEGGDVTMKGNIFGVGEDGQTIAGLSIGETFGSPAVRLEAANNGYDFVFGGVNQFGVDGLGDMGEANIVANADSGVILHGDAAGASTASIVGNIFGLIAGVGGVFDTAVPFSGDEAVALTLGGSSLASIVIGETVVAGDSTDKMNVITSIFDGAVGKTLTAAVNIGAPNVSTISIKNNRIGTDYLGVQDLNTAAGDPDSSDSGILISDIAAAAVVNIGGTASDEGNLISAIQGNGISINTSVNEGVINILGNIVGLNIDGDSALGNLWGAFILANGQTVNIGDGSAEGRNYFSGNGSGLNLKAGIINVLANYIGLDVTGTVALGNDELGIVVSMNLAGVPEDQESLVAVINDNKISGNGAGGIFATMLYSDVTISDNCIGLAADCETAVPNTAVEGNELFDGTGITVITEEADSTESAIKIDTNVIAGNEGAGIKFTTDYAIFNQDHTDGYIKNNYLGVLQDGVTLLANGGVGEIEMMSSEAGVISGLTIGGTGIENTINNSVADRPGIYLSNLAAADVENYSTLTASNDFTLGGTSTIRYWERWVDDVLVDWDPKISSGGGSSSGSGSVVVVGEGVVVEETEEEATEEEATEEETTPDLIEEPASEPEVVPVLEEGEEQLLDATRPVIDTVIDILPGEDRIDTGDLEELEEKFLMDKPVNVPEKYSEYYDGGTEVRGAVGEALLGEELTEEEKENVRVLVKGLVDDSLDKAFGEKCENSLVLKIDDSDGGEVKDNDLLGAYDFQISSGHPFAPDQPAFLTKEVVKQVVSDLQNIKQVNCIDEVEVLVNLFDEVSDEDVQKMKDEKEAEGKVLVVITNDSDHTGDDVSDFAKIMYGIPVFGAYELGDVAGKLWNSQNVYEKGQEAGDLPYAAVGFGEHGDNAIVGPKPFLRLVGEVDDVVDVILVDVNDFEKQTVIAENLELDEVGKGTLMGNKELVEGEYYVVVEGAKGPGKLAKITVSNDVGDVSLEATDEGFTGFQGMDGNAQTIIFTWKSVILSSVVIADVSQGDFKVTPPRGLPAGDHEVIAFAYNPSTGTMSNIRSLFFNRR